LAKPRQGIVSRREAVTTVAIPFGTRVVLAIAILAVVALAYGALGLAGFVPMPRSIASLADERRIGRGQALVTGIFEMQPFVANGNGLPPYALTDERGAKVRVSPTLNDLKPVQVVAVLDLATGDGSEWNPYAIRTLGSVPAVASGAIIAALVLVALAFWLAGPLAFALRTRPRSKAPQRAT
jgi:hypothetical protein